MGGFFGAVSKRDCLADVFFGVDYHSHLGTRRGGLAAYDKDIGLQRKIHNIENSPFRTKFEHIFEEMSGTSAIGCISDTDPQPLLIRSALGTYAICTVGVIKNSDKLIDLYLSNSRGGHFDAMTGGKVNSTELAAALIDTKSNFVEGISFCQNVIEGSLSILILCDDGSIIAARDKLGRTPVAIGKNSDGHCVSFESYPIMKLGYEDLCDLGPGQIVKLSTEKLTVLSTGNDQMKICAFLWAYYGYPTSSYEGVNVETMRYRNGRIMARNDTISPDQNIDYICGVPDSGTPHAIGYSNEKNLPFARPFIKYTPTWPRSFMPPTQADREKVAKMKLIPIHELIQDKDLLFVDDSIVRGTQLKETVDFLYENGAKSVHMRSACPPIMYNCKYLNFSSSRNEMELIARRVIMSLEGEEGFKYADEYSDSSTERGKNLRKAICEMFNFASLDFQSLSGIIDAIGIDPSKLCTYCWNGKE